MEQETCKVLNRPIVLSNYFILSFIFCYLLTAPLPGWSQKMGFTVKVVDKNTKQSIPGAQVYITEAKEEQVTDGKGQVKFSKIFLTDQLIRITITKDGYTPKQDVTKTVSNNENLNSEIIELEKNPGYMVYGDVKDEKGNDIVGARVEVRIGPTSNQNRTDSLGNFIFTFPKNNDYQDLVLEVKHPGFKPIRRPEAMQGRTSVSFNLELSRKFNWRPVGITGSALGLLSGSLIANQGRKDFQEAKDLYDSYVSNLTESAFLAEWPEYTNRAEAFETAEKERQAAATKIRVGIAVGTVSMAALTYLILKKKTIFRNTSSFRLTPSSIYPGAQLAYQF